MAPPHHRRYYGLPYYQQPQVVLIQQPPSLDLGGVALAGLALALVLVAFGGKGRRR